MTTRTTRKSIHIALAAITVISAALVELDKVRPGWIYLSLVSAVLLSLRQILGVHAATLPPEAPYAVKAFSGLGAVPMASVANPNDPPKFHIPPCKQD